MPLAPVDNEGTELHCEDSGPPAGLTDYVTLVICHGTVFHSGAFKPMFAHAPEHNMRIILVNLRDYPGSTPYSPAEKDIMFGQDYENKADFLQARGFEIAALLEWLIKKEDLPPIRSGSTAEGVKPFGGVALLGWSSGSATVLSLVANADKLSSETHVLLDGYLRTCFLWDPPSYACGSPLPAIDEYYSIVRDPTLTPNEIAEAIPVWVFAYYNHDPAVLDSLEDISLSRLAIGLSSQPLSAPLPTTQTFTPDEYNAIIDLPKALSSHVPFILMDGSIFQGNARRALSEKAVWPRLKIALVWFDMTLGDVILGAWYVLQLWKETENGRDFSSRRVRNVNHFSAALERTQESSDDAPGHDEVTLYTLAHMEVL
ncbi:hypothetical protein OBBRIDRAFT_833925 [Obba rivulosa]|uniref:AB hydrolase-1 domain-containing protein n=1 Tax=Obba rivulosa TaxID=1052685 RepID=A0A8E2B156_9APHY|nr:hypothetical protein OBBRIDRAFT_833925 [Obba rivulosa]